MKALRIIIAAVIMMPLLAAAQGPPPDMMEGPMRSKIRERVQTVKIWRLTEEVGLTTAQSEKFFPMYNRHQKNIDDLEIKRGDIVKKLEDLTLDRSASDSDIEKIYKEYTANARDIVAERERFLKDVSTVLDLRQKAKWIVFEDHFRQRMQELIQDIRREFRGGRGMNGRQ